ncbi:hypothetical protein B0H10DRAFT_2078409, partial [Mycena sp. CBHHK59/15]
ISRSISSPAPAQRGRARPSSVSGPRPIAASGTSTRAPPTCPVQGNIRSGVG